jgi:hypothetical protein
VLPSLGGNWPLIPEITFLGQAMRSKLQILYQPENSSIAEINGYGSGEIH